MTVDLDRARELGHAALLTLEASKRRLDDLNVYPVPDGDTGTNLALTVRAIVQALDASNAPDHASLGRELSRAALLGARGNSGVILSQIVRGFSDALGEADAIDGAALARAFRSASDAAYRAVQEPAEGTILTVVRELAEEAEKPEVLALASAGLFDRVVERGELAVARTTELLPILSEAGVVDAGGAGLLEIVRGLAAAVAGRIVPSETVDVEALGFEAIHQELSRYRYCTGFVVEGQGLDADELERELERLGDSLLVVGDSSALRIHVHTDDPGAALTAAIRRGAVDAVEIANMHKQSIEREQRLSLRDQRPSPPARTAVVAVALGAGNRRLFEQNPGELHVVVGGQTMNPSTEEILAAIEAAGAPEVVVLPNNSNVTLAAERAVDATAKRAVVVPSTSIPAGLAAVLAYDAARSADENDQSMREAIGGVRAGEVAVASRDATLDGIAVRKGSWFGAADGVAVASGASLDDVAEVVAERLLDNGADVLTILTGADAPPLESLRARLQERHPLLDIEVREGGQPHYPLLFWV